MSYLKLLAPTHATFPFPLSHYSASAMEHPALQADWTEETLKNATPNDYAKPPEGVYPPFCTKTRLLGN